MSEEVFTCTICGKIYDRQTMVDACMEAHNTVFVKFTRGELFRLLQFIYTHDDSLLDEDLMRKLRKYARGTYV